MAAIHKDGRRKLRVIIITMGGERQKYMEELFQNPSMARDFETPVFFSPGVPSRRLRNRVEFFRIAHQAGLVPDEEWNAIEEASLNPIYLKHTDRFFECLGAVPVAEGRRGSRYDVKLHYSVELWRKARTVNRGRAVLGCLLAHLIALKRFVSEDFDVILEDNARAPPEDCARRIWETIEASEENFKQIGVQCHFRYVGWLGSIPNLRWIYERHVRKTLVPHGGETNDRAPCSVFPFPRTQDVTEDLTSQAWASLDDIEGPDDGVGSKTASRQPGGNAVWGCYGYWISKDAYEQVLETLQSDVGSILWKGKRARFYSVKPVDKVLPRLVMTLFGHRSVQLPTHPSFFRAPMLTSKIHTQWDPEFCKSTEYQLRQSSLTWDDLWLTELERRVVEHHQTTGEWRTTGDLQENDSADP